MAITNQHFRIDEPTFPATSQTAEEYKDFFTQTFLEGYRFQLIDWKNNISNTENTNANTDTNFPTVESLTTEISNIETALTEKYGWTA
jgi:hypothetical protein|tara:strand:+ start:1591 stop:1854 length:264 start_codon:yes stop_codon:yes gene_type:complete